MKKHLPTKVFNEIKSTFAETKQNGFTTTVSARIVHEWLGIKSNYSTWIKRRIEKYGFEEHIDYCVTSSKTGIRSNVEQIEYHCTPDMVKP